MQRAGKRPHGHPVQLLAGQRECDRVEQDSPQLLTDTIPLVWLGKREQVARRGDRVLSGASLLSGWSVTSILA